jgi:hypothetical protein
MKKILMYSIVAIVLFVVYWFFLKPKPQSIDNKEKEIAIQKHSAAFNNNCQQIINNYLAIKDAFILADTAAIKSKTNIFIASLNSIDSIELKKDTASVYETVMSTISDIKINAASIVQQHDITEMRKDFSNMTDVMYPAFFFAINYEGTQLYLQNCPMAFNDSIPANWISGEKEINNPYLGKSHPVYQSSMLHCGEIKDTIKRK